MVMWIFCIFDQKQPHHIPYSTVPKDIEKQVEDKYDGDMIIRSVIVRPCNLKSDPAIRKEN